MVAALVLLMIVLVAVLAPLVAPMTPNFQHFTDPQQAPSATYVLGTDYEGRDILSRLIYGGQVSLEVAVLSVLLGTMVGSAWGVVSAYLGGKVDLLSQRMVEVVMAFPTMVLAMIFLIALGGGIWTVIMAIAITRLPFGVRVIRSVTLAIKELPYVDAARAVGASDLRIMARHIVPQCMPPSWSGDRAPGHGHCH